MQSPSDYDLVIAGAGFAGLCCAEIAAGKGLKTLVLERKKSAGAMIRTTGIVVKEAADIYAIPDRFVKTIPGVRLYSPSLNYFDLESPEYYFLATDMPGLMDWMADKARQAGADIHFHTSLKQTDIKNGRVEINRGAYSARYLIGADGARSKVARCMGLASNEKFLFGVEAEYENLGGVDDRFLHVFIDSDIARGYIGWIVPGVTSYQVGLACNRPHNPDLKQFVEKIKPLFDFSNAGISSHRAGLIPCGGVIKPHFNEHALLIGDAAGTVSPLTAGGIQPAYEIGQAAGHAVTDFLMNDGPRPEASIKKLLPSYRIKGFMRRMYSRYPLTNKTFNRLLNSRMFRSVAQAVFFHNRGLFSWAAWKDIFRSQRKRSNSSSKAK